MGRATRHRCTMLQDEAALASFERSCHPLNGNITRGALHRGYGAQHFALAGGFEIAVKLFVDRHTGESLVGSLIGESLGRQLHIKVSAYVRGHNFLLLRWADSCRILCLTESQEETDGKHASRHCAIHVYHLHSATSPGSDSFPCKAHPQSDFHDKEQFL